MSYHYITNHIANKYNEDIVCKFKLIVAYEVRLISYQPTFQLYWYNDMVGW